MGFDVHGIKPSNEPKPDSPNWEDDDQVKAYFKWQESTPGAYFRASVWSWHPVWDFVHNTCADIFETFIKEKKIDATDMDELYESCHHNDGFVIPEECAKKIAKRINKLDKFGMLKEEEELQEALDKKIPLEPCQVCDGKGTRQGWEGWESEKEWLKIHGSLTAVSPIGKFVTKAPELEAMVPASTEIGFKWANEMRGCNRCHGKGKVKPFSTNYKFQAKFMRTFIDFCKNSGGFKIW